MNIIREDSVYEAGLYDAGEGEQFVGPGYAGLRKGRYFVTYKPTPYEQKRGHGFYTDDLAAAIHRYDVELARTKRAR
ncbi:hypothetical protein ACLLKL_001954 [Escherichia coli]